MKLIQPQGVSEELLAQANEVLAGIALGAVGLVDCGGDDPEDVRRALLRADPVCRVYRAKGDAATVLRVRRYMPVELDERVAKRTARGKQKRAPRRPRAAEVLDKEVEED